MGGKKTTTTSKETATTTPNIPGYAQAPVQNYYNNIGGLDLLSNPGKYQTPTNALQTQAATSAGLLGNQPGYGASNNLATQAANAAAPQVQAQSVKLGGYTAAQSAPVKFDNPVAQAEAASLLDNFAAYMNPATAGLVDATLANYDDQSGRAAAQMKAQGAKAGAFGGSRYGIAEAQFAADNSRNRALTEAQLQNQAFQNAAGLSQYDASNRQQTGMFNAGSLNERTNLGAQLTTQNNQFNAGQTNDARRFTADAGNQGQMYNASSANQTSQFNANQQQQQLQNQLAAAGLLGNNATAAGNNARANAGLQMDIGNSLYAQQQANTMLPIALAQAQQGLLDPGLLAAISGRTVNSSGTNTQKQSGGLLGSLLGAATGLGSAYLGRG